MCYLGCEKRKRIFPNSMYIFCAHERASSLMGKIRLQGGGFRGSVKCEIGYAFVSVNFINIVYIKKFAGHSSPNILFSRTFL